MSVTVYPPGIERPVAPARTVLQRREALQRANEVRSARKEVKLDLKAGRVIVSELVLRPPGHLETAKVFDLLMAAPKVGRVKANKVLTKARISPSKTVGGLSPRQRAELAQALDGGARR